MSRTPGVEAPLSSRGPVEPARPGPWHPDRRSPAKSAAATSDALRRAASAVAHPSDAQLFSVLVRELAALLDVALVVVAVYADDARSRLRTLAVSLDGQPRTNFGFRHEDLDTRAGFFARERLDALVSVPLNDSAGEPLGLLLAMDRGPLSRWPAGHAESLLGLFGMRACAEIERERTEATLRAVALAVSGAGSGTVFDELVRLLATILHVDVAVVARYEPAHPEGLRVLAMYCDGQIHRDITYAFAGTPCGTVLGQHFRVYPKDLRKLFPGDSEMRDLGCEGYAGHPLAGLDGTPIGILSVASRRPLTQVGRLRATLKIFAVRAAAEVERLRASESQKQAMEDLRQREEQYRAIFESSLDGLFLWNENLRVVDANPAGLALYGYGRKDVIGRGFPSYMPRDYVRAREDMVRGALEGRTTHVETTVLRPNGTKFEADLRVMPFVHRGRPHALAVVRDISERRERERELQRSEEQYRAIFNASVDAMVLRDAQFRVVDVNATYQSMTGYSRAEVIGLDRVLANPEQAGAAIRALHAQALAGATVRLDTQLVRRDGHRYELELRGVPILHRGQPHVLYIGRDVTDRASAERRRNELERQLRQAQKMEAIGQLTGGLAHDFNNILTSVLGYIGMAQERDGAAADPALARQLEQARLAAERAREHVAQLLSFSRPRRGERKLLEPAQLAAQVLQLLRPNLPSSIAVDWEPPRDGGVAMPPVIADPVQFEQVLLNLCLNARDAIGEQGTIRLRTSHIAAVGHCASCSARLDAVSRWVVFEVTDDGSGMSREVIDRMFEPFFTTKDVGRGTGMGLAMVHGIVHDHGGHLQVRSTTGRGSTFRVLLPAGELPAAQADPGAAFTPSPACAAPLRGRVLLVEDEPNVGGFMQELMSGWGLQVVLERDPLRAARRLTAADQPFDLLLTDQTMPGMTGLALARHATHQRPGLPVLLYTGNASDIAEHELAACGVSRQLRKPVESSSLRRLLADLLGTHETARP